MIDIANSLKSEADNKPMIKPFIMVHGEPIVDKQSVVDAKLNDDDDDDDSSSSSEESIDDNTQVQTDLSDESDVGAFKNIHFY